MSDGSMILCSTWHRPLLRIVPSGIEIKCKFCNGAIQTITKEEIERLWQEMESQATEKDQELSMTAK